MLSDDHRKNRVGAALMSLEHYHSDGDKFLNQTVTENETWVSQFTPKIKSQLLRVAPCLITFKPRKFKQTLSTQKIMAMVFWDRKGVLLVEFMPQDTTINAEAYCATLRQL
jgi:hypothetical protein